MECEKALNACIMVTQAREIPECIRAFDILPISQVRFQGYTEMELGPIIDDFVRKSDYQAYLLCSDDIIPTVQVLNQVLKGLETNEAFTAWCEYWPGSKWSNVISKRPKPGMVRTAARYLGITDFIRSNWLGLYRWYITLGFMEVEQVRKKEGVFRTYWPGGCLTGMTRELWLRFGFKCLEDGNGGYGQDFVLASDLAKAEIEMKTSASAEVRHLAARHSWIMGRRKIQYFIPRDG